MLLHRIPLTYGAVLVVLLGYRLVRWAARLRQGTARPAVARPRR